MAGDQISDEIVEEFLRGAGRRAFADAADVDVLVAAWVDRVRACPQSWEDDRAGLAAALPLLRKQWEADALREAAEAYATQWRSAARLGRAVDLPRAEAGFVAWLNERATAPETVGALPVVAGSEAEASCQVNMWGGPYRACGRTLVNGKCGHHG